MIRFIIQHQGLLLTAFILGAIAPMIAIESVYNGGFAFAVKVLPLPIGLLVLSIALRARRDKRQKKPHPAVFWTGMALLCGLLVLMGWPYLMAVNTLSFATQPVIVSGEITGKFITRGKSGTIQHHITVQDRESHSAVDLNISETEDGKARIGDPWCTAFYPGLFGIPWRWRYGHDPALDEACR